MTHRRCVGCPSQLPSITCKGRPHSLLTHSTARGVSALPVQWAFGNPAAWCARATRSAGVLKERNVRLPRQHAQVILRHMIHHLRDDRAYLVGSCSPGARPSRAGCARARRAAGSRQQHDVEDDEAEGRTGHGPEPERCTPRGRWRRWHWRLHHTHRVRLSFRFPSGQQQRVVTDLLVKAVRQLQGAP